MENKLFTQNEVNRIVALRVKRERDRMTREFENCLKRCMASVHLTLHQEMCAMRRDAAAETQEPFVPGNEPKERPSLSHPGNPAKTNEKQGGERQ